jgi:hypothetical protein
VSSVCAGIFDHPVAREFAPLDTDQITASLNTVGYARVQSLLSSGMCHDIAAQYDDEASFRSRIVMSRHGFGSGEYKYFAYPLPRAVDALRAALYRAVVPIANEWNDGLRAAVTFPSTHAEYLQRCHEAGQARPTPLLLKYAAGDYNCLHQDVYGELVFPLQMAVLLSRPQADFSGGEFVLTEQRPRMQSRVHVVPLQQGDAVIFPVNHRPVQGLRGTYRVTMRHGVSPIVSGQRMTLGIILHDAA